MSVQTVLSHTVCRALISGLNFRVPIDTKSIRLGKIDESLPHSGDSATFSGYESVWSNSISVCLSGQVLILLSVIRSLKTQPRGDSVSDVRLLMADLKAVKVCENVRVIEEEEDGFLFFRSDFSNFTFWKFNFSWSKRLCLVSVSEVCSDSQNLTKIYV